MTEQIIELVQAMGRGNWEADLLEKLCQTVQGQLESRLRPGLTAQDCGGAFPIAAAWMVLELLEQSSGAGAVQSFSAGDLTVNTGGTQASRALGQQARKLMAPYCVEEGFAFRGVPG